MKSTRKGYLAFVALKTFWVSYEISFKMTKHERNKLPNVLRENAGEGVANLINLRWQ